MKIVITMAGEGIRFKKAGFSDPKPLIKYRGRSLLEWAIGSLDDFFDDEFILLCRDDVGILDSIPRILDCIGIEDYRVIALNEPTRGQADTAMKAKSFINKNDEIMIFNTDTHVNPGIMKREDIHGNGWIPVFKAVGDKWSFVRVANGSMKAEEVSEKIRISDLCSIGLYYFDTFSIFEESYHATYGIGLKEKSRTEQYIAPMYNYMIQSGKCVCAFPIMPNEGVKILGTPEDLVDL
ncbi:MAG: hypothetical protein WCK39_05555 [Methanomassiliicoccales archaeon]